MKFLGKSRKRLNQPLIFVCSPYRGDVNVHVKCARRYCRYVVKQGGIPFAPHLLFTQFLDDCLIDISYKTSQLRKVCEDAEVATKRYGSEMAVKIQMRIMQIKAATSVEMLVQKHVGRCHPLHGDRKGQYAMDLTHPYRLIFEKKNGKIVAVEILEIIDYH